MKLISYIGILTMIFYSSFLLGQNVSINSDGSSPNPTAILDLKDTTRGILIPRMSVSQRNAISNPATGLLIFQLNSDSGFYFNLGSPSTPSWNKISSGSFSSNWSQNGSSLFYNSGFVGIGTTSPQADLNLYAGGSFGAGARLVFGDDSHYLGGNSAVRAFIAEAGWDSNTDSDQLHMHGQNGHFFTVGGSTGTTSLDTAFRLTTAGTLVIREYSDFDHTMGMGRIGVDNNFIRMTGESGQIGLWYSSDSSYYALFSDAVGGSLMPEGSFGIYGGKNVGSAGLRFMINKAGDIGIGTNAPTAPLSFNNGISYKKISLYDVLDNDHQFLGFGTDGGILRYQVDQTTTDHVFYAATSSATSNELMRIGGNGFVGIRTNNPRVPLEIGGGAGTVGMIITEDKEIGIYNGDDFQIVHVDPANLNTIDRFTITSSGNLRIGGSGGTLITSDSSYKTNVVTLPHVLDNLRLLSGVYHHWDTLNFPQKDFKTSRDIGLIAQNLEIVYPELVVKGEDGFLAVNYSKFTAVLLQAIKEQQLLIDQQNQNNEKQQYQIDFLLEELNKIKSQPDEK